MTKKMTTAVDSAIAFVAQRGAEGYLDIDDSLDKWTEALTPSDEGEVEFVGSPSPRVEYLRTMYEGTAAPCGLNSSPLVTWESDNADRLPSVGGTLDCGQELSKW